jgi:hypothetical protein
MIKIFFQFENCLLEIVESDSLNSINFDTHLLIVYIFGETLI